jgi:hypothetical protein
MDDPIQCSCRPCVLPLDDRPISSRSLEWLDMAFILKGFEFGEPTRKALIVDLAPDSRNAGMSGLNYLIRDVFVAIAALGGVFLSQFSPQTNLLAAFVFGIIGTVGFVLFRRDIPVPVISKEAHHDPSS